MSTVLHFPDGSSFQAGINFVNSYAFFAKATEGTGYTNPEFNAFRNEAAENSVFFAAYHFLHAGNGAAQAEHYCSVVPANVAGAVDIEPTSLSRPTVQDAVDFITECRAQGRKMHLAYFPHWYWQQIGSPSLAALQGNGPVMLWSSDYTTYSDNGPGWAGYGGLEVAVWQYSSTVSYGGVNDVDFNAFKGNGRAASFHDLNNQLYNVLFTGKIDLEPNRD
jgi:GH25 family lysozyme M1 (1,4-beta-N-acetylmuramidase)